MLRKEPGLEVHLSQIVYGCIKGVERSVFYHAFDGGRLEGKDILCLHPYICRAHLLVVPHDDDPLGEIQQGQGKYVCLAGLVNDDEVEFRRISGQVLPDPGKGHDPSRHRPLGFQHAGPRLPQMAGSIFACALAQLFHSLAPAHQAGLQATAFHFVQEMVPGQGFCQLNGDFLQLRCQVPGFGSHPGYIHSGNRRHFHLQLLISPGCRCLLRSLQLQAHLVFQLLRPMGRASRQLAQQFLPPAVAWLYFLIVPETLISCFIQPAVPLGYSFP